MKFSACALLSILLLTCYPFFNVKGQAAPEKRLEDARRKAASKSYEDSRKIAQQILQNYPQYYDAQVFIGRTLAWQEMYDSARVVLSKVLKHSQSHFDALEAIADLELWAGKPVKSIEHAQLGIENYPDKDIFYLKKAKACMQLSLFEEADETLVLLLKIDPHHAEAFQLREKIKVYTYGHATETNYIYAFFSDNTPHWHWINLQQTRRLNKHLINFGLNYTYRFNTSAVQYDINAYPVLSQKVYAYLNAAYSQGVTFPRLRSGAELFRTLGENHEVSLGLRYFDFRESKSTIITGSLSQVYKSYLFTLRPYINFSDKSVAPAGSIIMRRYLKDNKFNFMSLSVNYGFVPDNPTQYAIVIQNVLPASEVYLLKSVGIRLDFQHDFYRSLKIKSLLSYEKEEFIQGRFRNRISTGFGLIYLY
jgi:YaiO family outer membrane protein